MFNFLKRQKPLGSIVQYSKETAIINPVMIANAYIHEYKLVLETLIDVLQTNKNILHRDVAFYIKGDSYEKIKSLVYTSDLSRVEPARIKSNGKIKLANIIFIDDVNYTNINQHNLVLDNNNKPLKCTKITVTLNQLLELNDYVNEYNKDLNTNENNIQQLSTSIKEIALELKEFTDKYLNHNNILNSLTRPDELDRESLKRFLLGHINVDCLIANIINHIKDCKLKDK
jgi:hypothetical protein